MIASLPVAYPTSEESHDALASRANLNQGDLAKEGEEKARLEESNGPPLTAEEALGNLVPPKSRRLRYKGGVALAREKWTRRFCVCREPSPRSLLRRDLVSLWGTLAAAECAEGCPWRKA